MVVLNFTLQPLGQGNMLKFESPKSNSVSKSNSLRKTKIAFEEHHLRNPKIKRRRLPSFLSTEKTEPLPSLPVPTVPPYPIECFDKASPACHSNRAFECTEEYLRTHTLSPKKERCKNGNLRRGNLSFCTPKHNPLRRSTKGDPKYENVKPQAHLTKDNNPLPLAPTRRKSVTLNARALPAKIYSTLRRPYPLKYLNTVGIPQPNATPNKVRNNPRPLRYLWDNPRLSFVPMPKVASGPTRYINKNIDHCNNDVPINCSAKKQGPPITSGTLKLQSNVPQIRNQRSSQKAILPTGSWSSESECFPNGGPPPYPGLPNTKRKTSFRSLSFRWPTRPIFPERWTSPCRQPPHFQPPSHDFHSSPIKVYSNTNEILISSLSPPPALPVKLSTGPATGTPNLIRTAPFYSSQETHPGKRSAKQFAPFTHEPNKPANCSQNGKNKGGSLAGTDNDAGSSSKTSSTRGDSCSQTTTKEVRERPKISAEGLFPPASKAIDFAEDDDQRKREFNVEVQIDYSKKHKCRLRSKKRLRGNEETSPSPLCGDTRSEGKAKVNQLNSKLKEITEIKTFKLGAVRVIRVGKWRFVALCCCGNTKRYVHQPGRIENYVPGFSSLSEKELRDNPEADVKLEIKPREPPVPAIHAHGGGRMQMSHALKESGYESDSTLVFRKREDQRRRLDPKSSSVIYRQIQRGGEIPLSGLQKPAPPKPRDDFYIAYSYLDIGVSAPDLFHLSDSSTPDAMSPPSTRNVSTASLSKVEKKRKDSPKDSSVPSPPRRLSSRWHPSLIRSTQAKRSVPPVPRSTSAERVRDTRALYSTWHREMVAKSKEKLVNCSPPRTPALEDPKTKESCDGRKTFLLDRRAVSESRFTLQDKHTKEVSRSESCRSTYKSVSKCPKEKKDEIRSDVKDKPSTSFTKVTPVTKHKPPFHRNREFSSLERPSKTSTTKMLTSRSVGTSPARSVDAQKWIPYNDVHSRFVKHTVSSLNKVRSSQPSSYQNIKCRSHSADESTKIVRHAGCLSPTYVASLPPKKSTSIKRDSSSTPSESMVDKIKASKKSLEQSESFDTTHSNETGYCSMVDLSSSNTEQKSQTVLSSKRKDGVHKPVQFASGAGSKTKERIHSATLPRRSEQRAHSVPGLRVRSSTFFNERLEKWQLISRGLSEDRPSSRSSTRSNSPLRSLGFVKKVSSSFKNIPSEVNSSEVPIIRSVSLENLSPSPHPDPKHYKEYILELKNAVPKSARICQLRQLFDSFEKIHRLERSTSTAELSTVDRCSCDIIDFDTWRNLRAHEKKALEYHLLLKQLNDAKKERDFVYNVSPHKKWSGDCRLRGREKHVSQLKSEFDCIARTRSSSSQSQRERLSDEKDTYKGLWRGSSVKDLSKNIDSVSTKSRPKRGTSLSLTREDAALRPKGLWTSLSLEQINALREQLTEIYGSMQSIRSWRQKREQLRELDAVTKDDAKTTPDRSRAVERNPKVMVSSSESRANFIEAGKSISDTINNLQQKPLLKSNLDEFNYQNSKSTKITKPVDKVEEQRKRLSKQLSIELQEKVAEQRNYQDKLLSSPPDRTYSLSPDSLSRSSPRTCYSLDVSDLSEPTSLPSNLGDNFLLVVRKPTENNGLPNDQGSDGESSDSDASVKTVIHKDVARKVKFFEKKARRNSRSGSRGSSLIIDPSEVPHYATLPFRYKNRHHKTDLFSSNLLPVRSASSVSLNRHGYEREQVQPIYSNAKTTLKKDSSSYSRSYLVQVKTGDVHKLKERYESPEDLRIRCRSLPDIGSSISSKITPTDRTFIREQEIGDVKYTRTKYEQPRQAETCDRWQMPRDEYLPKSKIANTLTTLATRSPYFDEPCTVERISRRDSVEKSLLKRVHTGVVETVVDKFETEKPEDVSLVGQMFTSAPSIPELAKLSPLVPPRPPPPHTPPEKPLRSSSFSPRRLPETSTSPRPVKTSTPASSPQQNLERSLSCNYPKSDRSSFPTILNPRKTPQFTTLTPYDASAHIPKFRYIPPDSYGASKWTQSLERPRRLIKAISSKGEPPRRTQSFSPPPRGPSSLKYGMARPTSPSRHPFTYRHGRPLQPINSIGCTHNIYPPQSRPPPIPAPPVQYDPYTKTFYGSRPYRELSPESRVSVASTALSTSSFQSEQTRIRSPPPLSDQESLLKAQTAFREMKNKITSYSPPSNKVAETITKYETSKQIRSRLNQYPNYNTYPLRGPHTFKPAKSSPSDQKSNKSSARDQLEITAPRNRTVAREPSAKSVRWKEPVIGMVPYPPSQRHYGDLSYTDSPYKYNDSEVNIHYRTPVRLEHKETLSEEELSRRQEEHMKKVYEQERRKKYLAELEDIERRRHTDNFTPLQKSPIPLNRYDDESLGGVLGAKTPEPKQMAKALFSFTAQNKRELSFNRGDIVTIRRCIDKNWYEGEFRGSVGIFPCNYVEIVPFDSLKTLGRRASEGQARCRFNFQAQTAMELSLTKGEMIILTRRVDENWYEGRVGNRHGIFPVTYVDVVMEPGSDRPLSPSRDPMPRPALPPAHLLYNGASGMSSPYSTLGRSASQTETRSYNQLTVNTQQEPIPYRALYNYKPQNDDELELIEGDTVLVMEKCDDGWFVGTSKRTGLFGTFPGNYVERS